ALAINQVRGADDSCIGRCHYVDPGKTCQCSTWCTMAVFNNCCDDYGVVCNSAYSS
ncbi:unnamed protein product, partial [Polarella glacialis]